MVQGGYLAALSFLERTYHIVLRRALYVLRNIYQSSHELSGSLRLPAAQIDPVQLALMLYPEMSVETSIRAVCKLGDIVHEHREIVDINKFRKRQCFGVSFTRVFTYDLHCDISGDIDAYVYAVEFFQQTKQFCHSDTFLYGSGALRELFVTQYTIIVYIRDRKNIRFKQQISGFCKTISI